MDITNLCYNSKEKQERQIPSLIHLTSVMKEYSNILFLAWRSELALRLHNLEFDGYFSKSDIKANDDEVDVDVIWRLPNNYIREALNKLENELIDLGYNCCFRFGDVKDKDWFLYYKIELPDREEEMEEELSM